MLDFKKILSIYAIFILTISLSSGCSAKESSTNSTDIEIENVSNQSVESIPKFAVSVYNENDSFLDSICENIEILSSGKADVVFEYADNDRDIQLKQIDEMISQNIDILVVNLISAEDCQQIVDKAKSSDIPVIFFNREPDETAMKSYDKAKYIGATPLEAGIDEGEIVVDIWRSGNYDKNGNGAIDYIVLEGEQNNIDSIARKEWSIKTIEENGIATNQLSSVPCDWSKDKAKIAMEQLFSQFGNQIEFIISANDSMAVGAIEYLEQQGYNTGDSSKMIPIVGVDGLKIATDNIKAGKMSGTIVQDAIGTAKAIVSVGLNISSGKDFLYKTEYVYDETQYSIRIPYYKYDPLQEE